MDLSKANKILIIGCSGGGKSTLSRCLAKKYNLPIIHLDVHFWKPNWQQTHTEEWRDKVQELVKQEKWIMEGTFSESFDLRFPLADAIIFLDMPRGLCLWRAITRIFKYNKSRPRGDMAPGCHEKIDMGFYKYIWTFKKKINPLIYSAIDQYNSHSKLMVLKSTSEVRSFYQDLQLCDPREF